MNQRQPFKNRLLNWDRNTKNVAGLNMYICVQISTLPHNTKQTIKISRKSSPHHFDAKIAPDDIYTLKQQKRHQVEI